MQGTLHKSLLWKRIKNQRILIFMSLPFIIHIFIFKFLPLVGWVIAFQDYKPGHSYFNQTWVGLKHFKALFTDSQFINAIRNTLAMSGIKLVLGTVFSVFIAVLINETRKSMYRKTISVISYLPHFISWVVAANLVLEFLAPDGILNTIMLSIGMIKGPILFMGVPKMFWWIIGWSHVWKTVGFGAIIYLAAMTSINPELYEAAKVDGANRFRRILHITLPGIKATFIVLLIINIGNLLEAGYEQQYLLKNGLVQDYAEVFNLYVLRYGFDLMRFSYAAAAGLFRSLISILLIVIANSIARKLGEESLV